MGQHDFLEAYSRLPWLRAIVGKIAASVGSVNWRVGFVQRGGRPVRNYALSQSGDYDYRKGLIADLSRTGEFVELPEHPAIDLLGTANPFITGLGTRKVLQAHLELVGEAFWLLERNVLGAPFRIWPIPPNWVKELPTQSKPFYEINWSSITIRPPQEDVVAFFDDDPLNPYGRGTGPATALGDDLEIDEYAAKHAKSRFYNGAVPELLISVEGSNEPEVKRLETNFRHKVSGVFRQMTPYFINRKVQVQQLGADFRQVQLTELRKFERDLAVQVTGIPPEIFGILSSSNRATIKEAQNIFARWVLVPRLEVIRTTLQEKLMPLFDDRLILTYDSPVREDFQEKLDAAKVAPFAQTVGEWRELIGQEPFGDERDEMHAVPTNVQMVPSLLEIPDRAAPAAPVAASAKSETKGRNRKKELEAVRSVLRRMKVPA